MPADGRSGPERRRSPRFELELELHIDSEGSKYTARTRDVSAHGAMVDCDAVFPVGTVVRVTNDASGQTADFRVVWIWPGELPGYYRVGLELVEELDFWGESGDGGDPGN